MSKFVKLSSIAELTVGFVGTMAKQYEDEGIPFLRSLNIKPFKIISDDMKYVSAEFSNSLSKSILHKGDVVIVRTGIPGTCCVVPAEYDGCNCSDVVIVHPNTELVNPHYLAAYINFWGQRQIQNNKVGAIQQHFNVHSAEEMLIFLPDITEQEKIAKTIVALNGKIENNFSVCVELEAMAKTLYDYWFTQFDFPDENGKPYCSSGGEMVWNDQLKREIPKGWQVSSIGSVTRNYDSKRVPLSQNERDIMKGGIPYYGATGIMDYVNRHIFDGQYVLIAEDGSVMDVKGNPIVQMIWGKTWVNNHAHVLQGCNGYSNELLYLLLQHIPVVKIMTGSIQKKINQDNLNSYNIPQIPDPISQAFYENVKPMFEIIQSLQDENDELTKLRDWLLPVLMNGQATVE